MIFGNERRLMALNYLREEDGYFVFMDRYNALYYLSEKTLSESKTRWADKIKEYLKSSPNRQVFVWAKTKTEAGKEVLMISKVESFAE